MAGTQVQGGPGSTWPWSRTNLLIRAAAARLGVEAQGVSSEHSDFFMRLRWAAAPEGARAVLISKTRSPYLTQVAQTLSNNKFVSRSLLAARGLPVVESELFDEGADPREHAEARERAEAMLARHTRVVVKPNWGNRGVGVSTEITEISGLLAAYEHARAHDRDEEVLVEPHIEGINLRVTVIGGEVCAAAEIRRPVLVGDGRRTPAELLAAFNSDPRRAHWSRPALLGLDQIEAELVGARLEPLGVGLDEVMELGARVELCCDESEILDLSDELSPRWAEHARAAACLLGVDVAGVDLRGSAECLLGEGRGSGGRVLEVNAVPALHLHELPTQGRGRPVSEAFVRYCLQMPGAPGIRATVEV